MKHPGKPAQAKSYMLPNTIIHQRRILGITPVRQSNNGSCGPASLKMVLARFGVRKTEEELARLSETSRRSGANEGDLVRAAQRLGMRARHRKHITFRELKRYLREEFPIIVAWWKIDRPHFSVVVDLNRRSITLADPEASKFVRLQRRSFERVWFGFANERAVESRGAIVITPKSPSRRSSDSR